MPPRFPQLRTAFHTSARANSLSAAALPRAQKISADWKGTSATGGNTKNFIGGQFVESKASQWIDVHDPVSSFSIVKSKWTKFGSLVYPNRVDQGPPNHRHRVRAGCRRCLRGVQDMEQD